jgi:superfamily II DNA or RNA helicase
LIKSTLIIENCYSFLQTKDQEIKNLLWKKLRFPARNYWQNRLYKQRKWDGYNDFFKVKTGRFLTGLLPEVQLLLSKKKFSYQTEDRRSSINWRMNNIDENFMNFWLSEYNSNVSEEERKQDFKLRDFQPEIVNAAIRNNRGLIVAPTGSGKTLSMISIIKCIPTKCPTLILVGRKGLADDHYNDLQRWGTENLGRLYDKHKDPNYITVATWQSAHKLPWLLKTKVLIVDEIHEMMSVGPRKIYNKLKDCGVRIGISATPFKWGGKDKTNKFLTKGCFGPELKIQSGEGGRLTTKMMQEKNFLSESDCTFFIVKEPQIPHELYQDAVTKGIADNYHFHDIVLRLTKQLQGRTLILVERLAHGDILNKIIPNSLWVQGKDDLDTRRYVVDQLKKSKKNVVGIATQQIFNAGVNVFVNNLINAAGGKADHQIIQRMGRGLRVADDKPILYYYDFVFKINEYLEGHSEARIKIIEKEGHPVKVKEIDF